MLEITSLAALKDNYIYALVDRRGHAAVIDPGDDAPVRRWLSQTGHALTHILCTHHHPDHTAGVAALASDHPGLPVYCSEFDRARIPAANVTAAEDQPVVFHGQTIFVLATPGHTLGQIAYHLPEQKILFTGDTLFSAGCGRLFEGTPEQMFNSFGKFKALAPDTQVYFGHEYTRRNLEFVLARESDNADARAYLAQLPAVTTPTTLAREARVNPFYRARTPAEFAAWREARNHW